MGVVVGFAAIGAVRVIERARRKVNLPIIPCVTARARKKSV